MKNQNQLHLDEWIQGSGIDPEIASLNLESLDHQEEVFDRLYPNSNRRNGGRLTDEYLRYFEKCEKPSGWWFAPIDPETGCQMDWGQFKSDSDHPLSEVKYRSPKGQPCQPLCIKVPTSLAASIAEKLSLEYSGEEFWSWFLANDSVPLVVTEGVKKAAALWSHGIVAVALTGIYNAYIKLGEGKASKHILNDGLRQLCERREVHILFDSDPLTATKKQGNHAKQKLGLAIYKEAKPFSLHIATVPGTPGKKVGVDDFLLKGGNIKKVLKSAIPFLDWINPKKSKNWKAQLINLTETLGGRLRFNELTKDVELDGKVIDWNTFCLTYARDIDDHSYGMDRFNSLALAVAQDNTYHPVRDYLDSLEQDGYDLREVAVKYFGAKPNSLQCELVRLWLIGAVARVYEPGCKVDAALILFDPIGGIGKSTFLRKLCPAGEWFSDNVGDIKEKDERLKIHQHWIIEWAELDCIYGSRMDGIIKPFITCAVDNVRPPYAKASIRMPRSSVLAGTTNKREFLVAGGGDRRYWVIECSEKIDTKLLEQERDLIWGAAKAAYQSGEGWHLSFEKQAELSQMLSQFKMKREGQEEIEEFLMNLGNRETFTTEEMLRFLDVSKSDRKFTQQARRILEELGWKLTKLKFQGRSLRGYRKSLQKVPLTEPLKVESSGMGEPTQSQSGQLLEPSGSEVPLKSQTFGKKVENPKNPVIYDTSSPKPSEGEVLNDTGFLEKNDFTEIFETRRNPEPVVSNTDGCQENQGSAFSKGSAKTRGTSSKFKVGDIVWINDLPLVSCYGLTWGTIWKIHQVPETGGTEYQLEVDGEITCLIKESLLQIKPS